MRWARPLSVIATPLVVLLLACSETPTGPEGAAEADIGPVTGAVLTTANDGNGVQANLKEPFLQVTFVECANGGLGELVVIEGTLHIIFKENATHFQPMGASGIGLATEDVYQAVGVTRESTKVGDGGFPYVHTFVNNFHLVGPGPDNNFRVKQTVHVTVNANGDLTAEVNKTSTTCQ
jgi:hypothetical protein